MADELAISAAALDSVREELGRGETAIEESASSAPEGIDAGDLTAMLTGMMAKVLDRAADVSEGIAAVSAQVGEAGTHFWEIDTETAATYRGGQRAD